MNARPRSLMLALILASAAIRCEAAQAVSLPSGTPIAAWTALQKIDTAKLRQGDIIRLRMKYPVEVDDLIVIAEDTPVLARVESVDKPRKKDLAIRLIETTTVDDRRVPLSGTTVMQRWGRSNAVQNDVIGGNPLGAATAIATGAKRAPIWFDSLFVGATAEEVDVPRAAALSHQPVPKCKREFGYLSVANGADAPVSLYLDGQKAATLETASYLHQLLLSAGPHVAGIGENSEHIRFVVNSCRTVYVKVSAAALSRSNAVEGELARRKLKLVDDCEIEPAFLPQGVFVEQVRPQLCGTLSNRARR